MGSIGPNMMKYNVCRAKSGWGHTLTCHKKCGVAYTHKCGTNWEAAGSLDAKSTGSLWLWWRPKKIVAN